MKQNYSLQKTSPLMSTLLPTNLSDEVLHDCLHLVQDAELPHPDLADTPLSNPGLELFTDGYSYLLNGAHVTGAAVVSLHGIAWASPLLPYYSAQAAELIALRKACKIARDWFQVHFWSLSCDRRPVEAEGLLNI